MNLLELKEIIQDYLALPDNKSFLLSEFEREMGLHDSFRAIQAYGYKIIDTTLILSRGDIITERLFNLGIADRYNKLLIKTIYALAYDSIIVICSPELVVYLSYKYLSLTLPKKTNHYSDLTNIYMQMCNFIDFREKFLNEIRPAEFDELPIRSELFFKTIHNESAFVKISERPSNYLFGDYIYGVLKKKESEEGKYKVLYENDSVISKLKLAPSNSKQVLPYYPPNPDLRGMPKLKFDLKGFTNALHLRDMIEDFKLNLGYNPREPEDWEESSPNALEDIPFILKKYYNREVDDLIFCSQEAQLFKMKKNNEQNEKNEEKEADYAISISISPLTVMRCLVNFSIYRLLQYDIFEPDRKFYFFMYPAIDDNKDEITELFYGDVLTIFRGTFKYDGNFIASVFLVKQIVDFDIVFYNLLNNISFSLILKSFLEAGRYKAKYRFSLNKNRFVRYLLNQIVDLRTDEEKKMPKYVEEYLNFLTSTKKEEKEQELDENKKEFLDLEEEFSELKDLIEDDDDFDPEFEEEYQSLYNEVYDGEFEDEELTDEELIDKYKEDYMTEYDDEEEAEYWILVDHHRIERDKDEEKIFFCKKHVPEAYYGLDLFYKLYYAEKGEEKYREIYGTSIPADIKEELKERRAKGLPPLMDFIDRINERLKKKKENQTKQTSTNTIKVSLTKKLEKDVEKNDEN
ncbi:MAG: hypothetical protein ACTSRZ_13245 [Promethearchaeota archaeon]